MKKAQLGKSFFKEVQLNSPRQCLPDSELQQKNHRRELHRNSLQYYKGKEDNTFDAKGAGELTYGLAGLPGTLNINKNQTSIWQNTKDTYR